MEKSEIGLRLQLLFSAELKRERVEAGTQFNEGINTGLEMAEAVMKENAARFVLVDSDASEEGIDREIWKAGCRAVFGKLLDASGAKMGQTHFQLGMCQGVEAAKRVFGAVMDDYFDGARVIFVVTS